ncbi:hypothetical protein BH10CHL1_BH10CHL1_26540 [soil metagenome]
MTTHATGTFTMKTWDEKTWEGKPLKDAPGAKLTHAVITQTFQGDIEGEGTSQILMMYPDDKSASFTGLQRVVGRIGKRSGSFVLQVDGTYADSIAKATWVVMPGSGTEELRGLRGKGDYVSKHGDSNVPITLDYDFG